MPRVGKPVQYIGGELGATAKDWDAATVRWALLYPDAHEVGLPNQGVMILYEILNEIADVLAERAYSVWPDLEELMREHGVTQLTVDAHRPVGAFDLLGVSFATELGYTNLLTALDRGSGSRTVPLRGCAPRSRRCSPPNRCSCRGGRKAGRKRSTCGRRVFRSLSPTWPPFQRRPRTPVRARQRAGPGPKGRGRSDKIRPRASRMRPDMGYSTWWYGR